MDDVLNNFPPLKDYDAAAQLLSQLCPDFVKNDIEIDIGSPESFACLLYRNPDLFRCVEDARASRDPGDLETIWKTCINYHSLEKMTRQSLSRPNNVPLILQRISANLSALIKGEAEKVIWTLNRGDLDGTPDIERVDLGSFSEKREPLSMLLHELGNFQSEPRLRKRVKRLFRKGQNTFLVNASATGKTRLLYEGLCQHWGLYITCHADEREARALDVTLNRRIYDEGSLVRLLPHKSSLAFVPILAKNREIAVRRFSATLLAYLLIFRDFLKASNKASHAAKGAEGVQKRRWLLAQLTCQLLDWSDPFEEILIAIEWTPLEYLNEQLTKVIKDIQVLLPESVRKDGFFVVIDEANVATREIWSSKNTGSGPYPALKEIIRTWRDSLASFEGVPITFVVAGTGIPQSYFPSSSQEWSSWRWTSDTGAFDDPESQKKYVLSFLPPSLAQTPRFEALLRRIWDWHRLTASLVAMLLMDGVVHPHGVLNEYVKRLTGCDILDAETQDNITDEGQCDVNILFSNIGSTVRGRPPVKSTTHEVIMHYIITGHHPPCFGIGRVDLVSSGVGQFKDKDMSQISLDQPGPLIAAAIWLSDRSPDGEKPRSLTSFTEFCSYIQGHWANGDTYAPASYIALYFAHAFISAENYFFSDIFTILTAPAWLAATRRFTTQLVKLQKSEDGVIQEMIVTPSSLLPDAPPLGYSASSVDDLLAWLRHERPGIFCVCPPDCEADLIFVLKRCEGYVWVVLRTAGRGSPASLSPEYVYPESHFSEGGAPLWNGNVKTLSTDELWPEYEHLIVQNLFSRDQNDECVTRVSDDLFDAFKALPNSLAPAGQLSLLRVVATFPSEPSLPKQKTKESPVAVLNTATFEAVTEAIPPQDLIQTLVFSMHSKRSSGYPGDAFSPVKPNSRKAKTKRKMLETSAEISLRKDEFKQGDSSGTPRGAVASGFARASAVDSISTPVDVFSPAKPSSKKPKTKRKISENSDRKDEFKQGHWSEAVWQEIDYTPVDVSSPAKPPPKKPKTKQKTLDTPASRKDTLKYRDSSAGSAVHIEMASDTAGPVEPRRRGIPKRVDDFSPVKPSLKKPKKTKRKALESSGETLLRKDGSRHGDESAGTPRFGETAADAGPASPNMQ